MKFTIMGWELVGWLIDSGKQFFSHVVMGVVCLLK